MNSTINLDELRAESQKVKFLEKDFEVGYIPCGAGIPILEAYNEVMQHQDEDGKQIFVDKTIGLISLFCSFTEPDFTAEFIKANASNFQVSSFFHLIAQSIIKNFGQGLSDEEIENMAKESKKKEIGLKQ